MDSAHSLMASHTAAVRRNIGGFCCVAYPDSSGVWFGRAWHIVDWKPFFSCANLDSYQAVFEYYQDRVNGYKQLVLNML